MATLMRVPADNQFDFSRNRIEVQLRKIVKNVYQDRTGLGHCGQRQLGRRSTFIDIPSNGDHGRQCTELLDDLGFANIPGMDDEIRTLQGNQGLRAQESVGVGNQNRGTPQYTLFDATGPIPCAAGTLKVTTTPCGAAPRASSITRPAAQRRAAAADRRRSRQSYLPNSILMVSGCWTALTAEGRILDAPAKLFRRIKVEHLTRPNLLFLADRQVLHLFVNRGLKDGRACGSHLTLLLGSLGVLLSLQLRRACGIFNCFLLSLFSGFPQPCRLSCALVLDRLRLVTEIRCWGFSRNKDLRPNLGEDERPVEDLNRTAVGVFKMKSAPLGSCS